MKKYIINNFYICGNYIAGDCIDIHDNPSATVYHHQPVPSPATVEDVTPEGERTTCPFLVAEKLSELGLYTQEQFEVLFREAANTGKWEFLILEDMTKNRFLPSCRPHSRL